MPLPSLLVVCWQSLGLLDLQKHHPDLRLHVPWCSPCTHVCVQISPFHKDIGLEPTLITSI